MELRKSSVHNGMDIYRLLQAIPGEENGLTNPCNGLTFEEYQNRLKQFAQDIAAGKAEETSTTYYLYDDGIPVGFGSIRLVLTDELRRDGGNISYGIAPQYRGKGYGKKILALLLQECNRLGLDKVLVTIRLDNTASKAIALANGGSIAGQTDENVLIWIDTAPNN